MARNLLSETQLTAPFAHFPDGPDGAVHSDEVRPVFESLSERDQEWVTELVQKQDPRNPLTVPTLAVALGVSEPVTVGLVNLLHPEA